jgi:F-type H+-transporting ATPase subunit epsilon
MGTLNLEVVTPDKVLVSQEVDTVVAPGSEGEFGLLPGHVHFLSGIVPGELRFSAGNERVSLAVTNGFAEVSNDNVSVLVDAAERASDIDIDRALQASERAKKRLDKARGTEGVDIARAQAALQRSIVRISVAKKSM